MVVLSMLLLLLLLLPVEGDADAVGEETPQPGYEVSWYGMVQPPGDPTTVKIVSLGEDGRVQYVVGTLSIGAGEFVDVDAFRCRPLGTFCVFSTTDRHSTSYLYVLSTQGAVLQHKITLPDTIAHNLSVDMGTGAIITIGRSTRGLGTSVLSVMQSGQVTPVLNLTQALCPSCTVDVGASTQCSDNGAMWVGVRAGPTAADYLLSLSLKEGDILNSTTLQQSMLAALWAQCDDATITNAVGGATLLGGGRTVAYGRLSSAGAFLVEASAEVPLQDPPLVPSGLLSQPLNHGYFVALYPQGSGPGSDVAGYLAVGDFSKEGAPVGSMKLLPVDYYLIGAAVF